MSIIGNLINPNEILTELSNVILLLGGDFEIVELLRKIDKENNIEPKISEDDLLKIQHYLMDLSYSLEDTIDNAEKRLAQQGSITIIVKD